MSVRALFTDGRRIERVDHSTGLPILDGPHNDRINGALWVYTDGDQAVFEASKTHEGRHAAAFLDGFEGVFLPDGASTYNQACRADGIARAGCWAHARRKFFDARKAHPGAFVALKRIREVVSVGGRGLAAGRRRATSIASGTGPTVAGCLQSLGR